MIAFGIIFFSSPCRYFSRFFSSSRFLVLVSFQYFVLASSLILSELRPSAYHFISSIVPLPP